MSEAEIPLSPIAGWTIAPVSAYRAVMLSLDFLAHATQQPDEALHSPHFVLTVQQARELAAALTKHAALSESGGPQGAGLPKH